MIYLKLYLAMLKIALLSFGGAYSIWALMEKEIVSECSGDQSPDQLLLCRSEFNSALAVAEILPGPQVNPISLLAHKRYGISGMLVLIAALLTPGIVLIPVLHRAYARLQVVRFFRLFFSGAILATLAVIISFILKLSAPLLLGYNYHTALISMLILGAFWAAFRLKISPLAIVAVAGTAGYFFL